MVKRTLLDLHKGTLDSRMRTRMSTTFFHRTTMSERKPTSFWQEQRDTVIILLQGFANILSLLKTSQEHSSSFGIFRSAKRLTY